MPASPNARRSPSGRSSAADLGTRSLLQPKKDADAQLHVEATVAAVRATADDGAGTLLSNKASLRAGAMLAQICERALIEHQLASCHFAFLNFCEYAPGP